MIDCGKKNGFHTFTFYKCISISNPSILRQRIRKQAANLQIIGTIMLTEEGINSTISSVSQENLNKMITLLEKRFGKIKFRKSFSENKPFKRLKVKVRKEIVPSGTNVSLEKKSSNYVKPENWDDFINQDSVITIDVRNNYEVKVGTFSNSISPETKNFREFNSFIESSRNNFENKKLALFCTGGIRCEKASALFNEKGFNDVYQLEGGILNYFKKSKDKKNFDGECFVFDDRVTVDKNLNPGDFIQCFACRRPISKIDKNRPEYTEGISCHNCINEKSDDDRKRFSDRQNQNLLNNKK
jgi:UPF0176 protein